MVAASWQQSPTPAFDWAEKAALWARLNSDDGWAGRQRPGGATSVRQLPRVNARKAAQLAYAVCINLGLFSILSNFTQSNSLEVW